jgi:glycine hydroxymethyltransferase
MKLVLSNTTPTIIEKGENQGQKSKAKYTLEAPAANEARSRIRTLLDQYPLYPEIDLQMLLSKSGIDN